MHLAHLQTHRDPLLLQYLDFAGVWFNPMGVNVSYYTKDSLYAHKTYCHIFTSNACKKLASVIIIIMTIFTKKRGYISQKICFVFMCILER